MAVRDSSARVLIIDNLAVESLRREVYRVLARTFSCEVHILVPTGWKETRDAVLCEPESGNEVHLHCSRIAFGYRHQRVLYLDLPAVIRKVKPHFILAVAQPESYAGAQVCIDRAIYARGAALGLFSSRNIDFSRDGFPYRFQFTHRICDIITRKSRPDICFYRPGAAAPLLDGYAKRKVYVPHTVDCSFFRKAKGTRDQHDRTHFVIGYLGRMVREKGLPVLLAALTRLPGNARIILIGTGPDVDAFRAIAGRLGVVDRVEFRPPVPYSDVPAALGEMDVFVLPSLETRTWSELFGRVLIEAMASELPIIASRSGGIPEVMGDAGLLVPPGDDAALAAALMQLYQDAEFRRDLGRKGRERALSLFDVPVVARTLGTEIMNSIGFADSEGKDS